MTSESALVSVRVGEERDFGAVNAIANPEGMGPLPSMDNVYVAVNDVDEVVGFIRLAFSDEGVCHVEPVAVYPTWRGYGVGRVLIEFALEQYGELRLVARGESTPFYERLGFEPISWDDIAPGVTEDCIGCEHIDECNPQPMRKVR